jgi:multidrug efflux system outer membrane protein
VKPRSALLAGAALLAGCAMGPGYRPVSPVAPAERVGGGEHVGARADSARAFYDSLAATRAADTARAAALPPPRALTAGALADLAWLDILQDSVLSRLVTTALRQNSDVAVARARVEEYRALEGVARAPLFPSLTLNGSASRNQIALGAFPPVAFNAYRVTGDLAWELDFWGKTRRGLEAAGADEAAQEAAARGAVLSLVGDVAAGYLRLLELDQEHAVAEQTLASRQSTLALARQRFARGVISELDVRQFEAQVAVPAARLAQVDQLRSQQEHALNVLLGEGPAPIPDRKSVV